MFPVIPVFRIIQENRQEDKSRPVLRYCEDKSIDVKLYNRFYEKECAEMPNGKPVLINLLAIAKYEHAPDYPIQFITRGTLHLGEKDEAVLEYTESQQDEETGEIITAQITLAMEKNRVTMTRQGDYSNTMVFVPEQRFEGVYQTPFGNMDMAVFARRVRCDIGERKGSVHLKYQLDIQGQFSSVREMRIKFAPSRRA